MLVILIQSISKILFIHLQFGDKAVTEKTKQKLSQEENFHSYQQVDCCETSKNLCQIC